MPKIFLIACEASGDAHGADLVRAVKKIDPSVEFEGLGGREMEQAGVKLLHEMTRVSVLGLGDVLRKYFYFRRIFYRALSEVGKTRPDLLILIDSPAFNLRFAKKIKKQIPVLYYISPQIWAWGARRIHTIRRTVSHMMVLLPFEEEIYKKAGVPCTFVGHPLLDRVKPTKSRDALREELGLKEAETMIALLPGSREPEVRRIFPTMLETARILQKKIISSSPPPSPPLGEREKTNQSPSPLRGEGQGEGKLKFFLVQAPHVPPSIYEEIHRRYADVPLQKMTERLYDVVFAADFALVASGTATLETALLGTPYFLLYKAGASTFFFGRRLVKIPYIGLVNVLAGRPVVPEFIQYLADPKRIAHEAKSLLENKGLQEKLKKEIREVLSGLGEPGASDRAAQVVLSVIARARSARSNLRTQIASSA